MAIFHFAYTFNFESFHLALRKKVVQNGEINLLHLQQEAKSVVDNSSDELKKVLSNIKYDKVWLDDPDRDGSQAYLWFTIMLASAFNPAPSLSNKSVSVKKEITS